MVSKELAKSRAEQMQSDSSAEPKEEVLSLLEVFSAVVCNQHLE